MLGTGNDQLLRLVSAIPLRAEVTAFLIDREAQGLSPRTIDLYRSELGYFADYLRDLGVSDLLDLTPNLIRRWLLDLGQTRNPGGIHVNYRTLKTFLRWAWTEYEIETVNPILKVKPPKVPQDMLEPLSLADLKAMLVTCDRKAFTGCRDRAVLLGLLDTGCRASEFVALDVGDLNLSTGVVLVRHGKGDKARVVFLGAKSRRALVRYLRVKPDAPALWTSKAGERLSYWGLRQVVRRRAKRAGVQTPSLHSFRRSFALLSLRNGADIYSLQRLMGHSDLTVPRRYLCQTEDDLRAAHRRAGPVDHML